MSASELKNCNTAATTPNQHQHIALGGRSTGLRAAWFALPLACALLAAAGPAPAQTTRLLVGNTTAGTAGTWTISNPGRHVAQAFTTGSNSTGYTVRNVEISFLETPTANDLSNLKVTIRTANGRSPSGRVVGTFSNPSSRSSGSNTFTARGGGINLKPNTTYFIHLDVSNSFLSTDLRVRSRTGRYAEDSSSLSGWSIANSMNAFVSGSWGDSDAYVLQLELNGYARSADATEVLDTPPPRRHCSCSSPAARPRFPKARRSRISSSSSPAPSPTPTRRRWTFRSRWAAPPSGAWTTRCRPARQ